MKANIPRIGRWFVFTSLVTMIALVLAVVPSALAATLGDSKFEIDTDANLKVDTAGNVDWLNDAGTAFRSGVLVKADLPTGSGDNSFGQGTKEDTAVPTVVDGSIPPNKSDLKNFGVFVQKTATSSFLHLFWTRVQDPTGTTNMDFEFNQSSVLSSNGVTPVRTPGDLLITYDLSNGGTVATISKRTWNGSVWGPATALTGGQAIGTINTSAIPAGESGGIGPFSVRTFGEASIDLSTIFTPGTCTSFGSAYLKSRSSDTFSSALKDFIAPEPVSVTNCGSALVHKTDASNGELIAGATFTIAKGQVINGVEAASSTMTEVSTGVFCTDNLLFGQHTVTETAPPPGYDLSSPASQIVNVTDNGTCAARLASSSPPDLTFANPPSLGAIKITKTGQNKGAGGSAPLAGVVFTVSKPGFSQDTPPTDASGLTCIDGLPLGTYTITEKTVPAGYQKAPDQTAPVTASATCSSGPAVPRSFVNIPLSRITVSFQSLAGPGVTEATIQCTGDAAEAALPEGTPKVLDNLVPGTYTCTVVVDP